MKTATALFILLAAASAARAQTVDPTPYAWEFPQVSGIAGGADSMRTELQGHVQAILDAGHLAPLYISYSDQASVGYAVYLEPGRILTTLAWAFPHLTSGQQTAVKAYVAAELGSAASAPWGTYPMAKNLGTPRELHSKTKWWYESATFGQYRPSVQTIYGLWLYGWRTGDWTTIQNNWSSIKTMYSSRSAQGNLYGTMGAHVAMVRLADRFGDATARTTAWNNLQAALNQGLTFSEIELNCNSRPQTWNAPYVDMYDARMNSSTYHGWMFLNLSPEIGRFLRDRVQTDVLNRHATGKSAFPFWWLAKANYFNRSWTGDEGSGLLPEVMGMMAPVERWVVQSSAATLKGQMVGSPTGLGDCYWLEALVQAIEAYGTIAWTDVRTGTTNALPAVTITLPANNATFTAPASITINATATDSDGTVAKVDFYHDGNLISTDTGSPYSASWTNVAAGTYQLTAQATDNQGGVGVSGTITIVVNSAPPTLYALTVNSGTGDGSYAAGTVVTIVANAPGAGMVFDQWTGAAVANAASATTTITMPAAATSVTATYVSSGPGVPAPWITQDIGATGVAGSANYASGAFTVVGSGADIWGAADAFRLVYQPLSGDGQIVARVFSLQNADPWTKAGVMIRETLQPGSIHAMTLVSPGNGTAYQRRLATGGASFTTPGDSGSAPYWVRIQRNGASIRSYVSADGRAWTQIGTESITMAANVLIGLAVTSHNNAATAQAVFDHVLVIPGTDTDGDGIPDSLETPAGFDPAVADQDADGIPDGFNDWNGNGASNIDDLLNGLPAGTPPATGGGGGGGGGGGHARASRSKFNCGLMGFESMLALALLQLLRRAKNGAARRT